ncbi:MAG: replication restart helicase PriA [Candidatus Latescibacterota bacterium]
MPLFVSIALPLPLNEAFIYHAPPELEALAEVGRRALVPFGPRMLTGFIVGTSDDPGDVPTGKIRDVQDIPDDEPVFDSHMLELSGWVAEYYLSSLGEALKTALPGGSMVRSRVRVSLAADISDEGALNDRQKQVLNLLRERGPSLLRKIQSELGAWAPATVRVLERKGLARLEREMTAPAAKIKTERHVRPVPDAEAILPSRARKQAECLELLRKYPEGIPVAEFVERHGCSRGVLNALVDAGLAAFEEVEVIRNSKMLDQEHVRTDHPLTPAQTECLRLIDAECRGGSPRPILIQGVTGSGKTRVYIELVRRALEQGKGAIILVPEIALTPQTVRFFNSVFPGRVAVLHSAMSPGERFDMWRLIRDGSREVVIGPRSAIFAPLASPGVIIVDEEHDHSYKQTDTAPRYHARDVAVVRGKLLGIPVALGSATPSLESWQNALSGKYLLARLPERIDSRPLPEVAVVDMREEHKTGNRSSLSLILRDELSLRIQRGEKSIVLINRRGFATGIRCRNCGHALTCPDCSAGLVFHASRRLAVCHLCGHERIVLQHCPDCGAEELMYTGRGTQRIERELANAYEDAGIVRMDFRHHPGARFAFSAAGGVPHRRGPHPARHADGRQRAGYPGGDARRGHRG